MTNVSTDTFSKPESSEWFRNYLSPQYHCFVWQICKCTNLQCSVFTSYYIQRRLRKIWSYLKQRNWTRFRPDLRKPTSRLCANISSPYKTFSNIPRHNLKLLARDRNHSFIQNIFSFPPCIKVNTNWKSLAFLFDLAYVKESSASLVQIIWIPSKPTYNSKGILTQCPDTVTLKNTQVKAINITLVTNWGAKMTNSSFTGNSFCIIQAGKHESSRQKREYPFTQMEVHELLRMDCLFDFTIPWPCTNWLNVTSFQVTCCGNLRHRWLS